MSDVTEYFREQGREQGHEQVVIVMIKNNEPDEKIGRYTGLSIKRINELRKRLDTQ